MASEAQDQITEFKVESPSDYSQLARLREIHDSRKQSKHILEDAFEYELLGQLTRDQANSYYRQAVKSHIMDIYGLLNDEKITNANHYWNEIELGVIEPTINLDTNEYKLDPQAVQINGLRSIIDAPDKIQFTVFIENNHPVTGSSETTKEYYQTIPKRILDNAVMACDDFRREIPGLDLDPAEQQEDTANPV